MGQQHVRGHLAAALVPGVRGREGRQPIDDGLIEIEKLAIVQEHGDGGGGEDFGQTGKIVDSIDPDRVRSMVVGETAEAVEGAHLAAEEHSPNAAGKDTSVDGVRDHLAGCGELFVLTTGCGWHLLFRYFPGRVHSCLR